ncbi:ankyrin repeat domain-containing protein [Wolbachia endosymbiont (group A) of Urophora cardui]|uniref:ankyrin repeat domain-containing protein n=1 Tax=Wolbachia endosymbiont (group A) of Urophora cardui TaxID=3066156 RepID=UPI00333F33A5
MIGTQESKKLHLDSKYELIKECLQLSRSDVLTGGTQSSYASNLNNLVRLLFVKVSDLTENQKKLDEELLTILSDCLFLHHYCDYIYSDIESYFCCEEDYLHPDEYRSYEEKLKLHDASFERLEKFLRDNKNNQDLKTVLNLKRGESGTTMFHMVSGIGDDALMGLLLKAGANHSIRDNRGKTPLHYAAIWSDCISSLIKAGVDPNTQDIKGKTPLHYAAHSGNSKNIDLLLENGAKRDILDKQGKIPLLIAVDNRKNDGELHLITDNQYRLTNELHGIIKGRGVRSIDWSDYNIEVTKNLKEFLDKHRNNQDLKVALNTRNPHGQSEVLRRARDHFGDGSEIENLLLEAGATNYERDICHIKGCGSSEGCLHESKTLWNNLTPYQQKMLGKFFDMVSQVQNMGKLEEVVDEAIKFGVRFNFPQQKILQDEATGKYVLGYHVLRCGPEYNLTDYVIKRISELKKDPKVASDIICKLVSKGAVLYNKDSMEVINALESEFKDHKTNMKKAYTDHVNRIQKFMEIVESAHNGKVKNAKMDNSTFYLEYSEDSKIDVAKITDGARSLGLTQGEIEYGRDIIKIGKSEVEIITANGIRHYTDLADNSNIVLTFYTSLGELEVNLYPGKQDKIIVEVSNKKEILEKFKNCKEELGKNYSFGGYLVYDAIEQGYFERSGKLMRSEAMSQSNGKTEESWCERISRVSNSEQTTSRTIG